MFEQVLDTVTPSYSDKINFYKVDIEEEPEMASLFRVMSVPQVSMIRKNGSREQAIWWYGFRSIKVLVGWINFLIKKIKYIYL